MRRDIFNWCSIKQQRQKETAGSVERSRGKRRQIGAKKETGQSQQCHQKPKMKRQ